MPVIGALAATAVLWWIVIPARVERALAAARAAERARRAITVTRGPARQLDAPAREDIQFFGPTGEHRDGLDAFGRRWIATGGGLLVLDGNGRWRRTLTAIDGLATPDVTVLARWGGELVVGGADGSVTLIDGERVQAVRFGLEREAPVTGLAAVDARLYVATLGGGLLTWDGQRAERVPAAAGATAPTDLTALAVGDGGVAIGTHAGEIFVERAGALVPLGATGADAAALGPVGALAWDGDALLVGRPFGLERLAADGTSRIVRGDVFVTALLVDASGNRTLVGTFDQGVFTLGAPGAEGVPGARGGGHVITLRVLADRAVAFGPGVRNPVAPAASLPPPALPGAPVTALAAHDGEIWAGSFEHGVGRLAADGRALAPYDPPAGYGLDQINALLARAGDGTLVMATVRGALWLDAAGGARRTTVQDGLGGEQVAAVALDGTRVAYATNRGLTVVDGAGAARSLGALHGLPNQHATAVAFGAGGRLYVGTLGGLAIVSPELRVERTLGAGARALGAAWVTALAPAGEGMYVGTYGGGLALVGPDGEPVAVDRPPGTRGKPVRVNPGALLVHDDLVLVGTLDHGLLLYDRAMRRWRGFAALPPGARNVTAIAFIDDALWLGTEHGLYRLAPELLAPPARTAAR